MRGDQRQPPSDGRRRFAPVTVAVMLAGMLLALSGALELAGAMPWPFDASPKVAVQEVLPTPTPSPTPTPTPTPTPKPTAAPAQPVYIPPAGSYSLGCGTPGPKALDFVVRAGTAAHGVALTFDDGPSPDYTANILSTLEQTHTPATFFVVGSNAAKYPDLIAREAKDGAVAMHTYDHPYMTRISPESRAWELTATLQAVHAALGPNYCVQFWRPPFGDYNADVLTLTHAMGLTTVTWNVDPEDWSSPGVQVIVDRVLAAAQPGSIILLHDGYFGRWQTAQALPQIITGLRAKGFKLVTVPQLLAGGQ